MSEPPRMIRFPDGYSPKEVAAFRAGWAAAYDAVKDDLHEALAREMRAGVKWCAHDCPCRRIHTDMDRNREAV
jgi:hypothetical protein